MNMVHLVWMTLPSGDDSGRGDRLREALSRMGVEPQTAVALVNDGTDDVLPAETAATLLDVNRSLDQGAGVEDTGWRAAAGEASLVIGPFTLGERRGIVLRFQQSDLEELDSVIRGGRLLDLIAAVHEICGALDVIWARDMSAGDLIGMLEADGCDADPGDLDHVAAVAGAGENLTKLMEISGSTVSAGSLSFAARRWALPNG